MHDTLPRQLKTGGDPRTLPDYVALRDELNKLTHPARPDVDWHHAEKCCLSLFELNGVELQTAAWYTLARTELAGLPGLNDGLTILATLISHHWGALWPQPVHARLTILSSLIQRLQQRMRAIPLRYSDLSQLYLAEQQLTALGETLQRLELRHLSQLDGLRILMHNSAARLEQTEGDSVCRQNITLPAITVKEVRISDRAHCDIPVKAQHCPDETQTSMPLLQPEEQRQATTAGPKRAWKSFAAGMGTMLITGSFVIGVGHYLHQTDSLQTQFAASLAVLPAALTPEQLDALQHRNPLPQALLAETAQQLTRLDRLPPDWNIRYSQQLAEQAQKLWPEQAKPLMQRWQQQLSAAALPKEQLNGWHQGMSSLQKLSDRLNGLDEQKGKYMTVSELKSAVFSTIQAFNQSPPAEEQLRILSQMPADEPLPDAASAQLEMHLKQLIARYAEIRQRASR